MKLTKLERRQNRGDRIRKKIGGGTAEKPRLVVFRGNRSISAQIIDDSVGKTIVSAHSIKEKNGSTIASAELVGGDLAQKASASKIKQVIFDRNGYAFHGKVKALADAARKGGLEF